MKKDFKKIFCTVAVVVLALFGGFNISEISNYLDLDLGIENVSNSTSTFDEYETVIGNLKNDTTELYEVINDNEPIFEDTTTTEAFEIYSDLDSLDRPGVAYANICMELMPTEDRESISSVTPAGWHTYSYDFVSGGYLYNRSHLIGFQLAGENANEKNLITGTRSFNVDGMLPFENMVADYVQETNNHVLYRVTPIYEGDNLIASGVQMEALSVEDNGEGVKFNVFVYNKEDGVIINYADGTSEIAD